MAAPTAKGIKNWKTFEIWLNAQSKNQRRQKAVALASRAALRALPFLGSMEAKEFIEQHGSTLTFMTLRANAISRVATIYPNSPIAPAAAAAASAADAAAYTPIYAATTNPTNASAAAASAAASAASASTSASALTFAVVAAQQSARFTDTFANSSMWKAISHDATHLDHGGHPNSLGDLPLWLTEPPDWWLETMSLFGKFLNQLDDLAPEAENTNHWHIWLDWYNPIAAGKPAFNLPKNIAKTLDMRIALGDNRKNFWNRPPHIINAEIVAWVTEAQVSRVFNEEQTSGLQFEWRDGLVRLARGLGLSSQEDEQRRIKAQIPILLELGRRLIKPKPQSHGGDFCEGEIG